MLTPKVAETWPVCTVCNGWVMLLVCMGKTRFRGIIWGELVMMHAQKFPISMCFLRVPACLPKGCTLHYSVASSDARGAVRGAVRGAFQHPLRTCFRPMAKATAVTTLFPYTGLPRPLLSPKTQIMRSAFLHSTGTAPNRKLAFPCTHLTRHQQCLVFSLLNPSITSARGVSGHLQLPLAPFRVIKWDAVAWNVSKSGVQKGIHAQSYHGIRTNSASGDTGTGR